MYYKFCYGKNSILFAPHKQVPDPKNKKKLINCLELYKRKLKKDCAILDGDGKKIA